MKSIKRQNSFNVEEITNGFLFKFDGRSEQNDWVSDTLYVADQGALELMINQWLLMEQDT